MRALLGAVAIVLALVVPAQAKDTPASLSGVTVVSAAEAKALLEAGKVRVYDLRKKASFAEGHVPSATNVASAYDEDSKRLDTRHFGLEPNAPVLFYSHGADGWKSYWAAKSAVEASFTTVYWMRGGMAEWEAGGLPVAR